MPHGLRYGSRIATPVINSHNIFRKNLQTQRFTAFTPPDPSKLPGPGGSRKPRKWLRRFVILGAGFGIVYAVDRQWYAKSLTRSLRSFYTAFVIGCDYKLNFRKDPWFGQSIEDVHRRSANRVFNLLRENGSLYLKIGQAVAMQSAILPPEFQKMFARMFDDAPANDWADVEQVIFEEFGKGAEEVFGVSFSGDSSKGVLDRHARASASIAQVHWARLPTGEEVAIKIQKSEIASQVSWDLWTFSVLSRIYSWWFDLPIYTLVPYVSERLLLETDFVNEANNAEETRRFIAQEPRLRGRVYIPRVFREMSSKRVMTAEWIEGVRLWDKDEISAAWYGGWGEGSPGAGGTKLEKVSPTAAESEPMKPLRKEWKGPLGKGGLGLSLKSVMDIIIDLFAAQMFLAGFVHCDPHPGNILVRRLPSGKPEVVLLDHGLYVRLNPELRRQYAEFWKALLSFDNAKISQVVRSWGVNQPDLFASATLLRPYEGGDTAAELKRDLVGKTESERAYELQMKMRASFKEILGDENLWPRELLFISRNLRITQGLNQAFGSPVNRIKITGLWASRALVENQDLSLVQRTANLFKHMLFRTVLFGTDLIWWWYRLRQLVGIGRGMDDEIEERMRNMAKEFGVELQGNVFDG